MTKIPPAFCYCRCLRNHTWAMQRTKLKMMKIYKILKCPNFVKVSTMESPCSCFKERQLQATLQYHFHKINYIDRTTTLISPCHIKIDINIFFLSYYGKMNLLYAMLSSKCFLWKNHVYLLIKNFTAWCLIFFIRYDMKIMAWHFYIASDITDRCYFV